MVTVLARGLEVELDAKARRQRVLRAIHCDEAITHVLGLARTTRRPAYDMFYLALARREDALLVTAAAALRREAERQAIRVV